MENLLIHSTDINRDFISLYYSMYMQGLWKVQTNFTGNPAVINMQKELLDYQELCSADCHNELFKASQGHIVNNCCSTGSTLSSTSSQTNCCPKGSTYNTSTGLCEGTIDTPPVPGCTCYTLTTNITWYDYSIAYCNGITGTLRVFPGAPQNVCATAVPVVLGFGPSTSGSESRIPSGNCYGTSGTTYSCTPTTIVTSTSPTIPCPCCPDGYTYISIMGYCQGVSATDVVDTIDCPSVCKDSTGKVTPFAPCADLVLDSNILIYPVATGTVTPTIDCCQDDCCR